MRTTPTLFSRWLPTQIPQRATLFLRRTTLPIKLARRDLHLLQTLAALLRGQSPNTSGIPDHPRKPKNNPFSAEEIAAEERRPKKKVAVLFGYSGTGYRGLQINNEEKTIEGDVMKAFIAAGAISKANADDPKSLKLIVEDDHVVEKINENLPPQIRVWGIQRTNKGFSCYQSCDSRWYEYLLPSYSLLPPHPDSYLGKKIAEFALEKGTVEELREKNADVGDYWKETRATVMERLKLSVDVPIDGAPAAGVEPETSAPEPPKAPSPESAAEAEQGAAGDAQDNTGFAQRELGPVDFALRDIKLAYVAAKRRYRISPARLQRLQSALDAYPGTHNFHNYTVQKSFKDPDGVAFLKVHGQSFMMHQIRKMVGLATLVTRCGTNPALINETYEATPIAIPKAPALGLLLERPVFQSYNSKATGTLEREPIDFAKYDDAIEPFKREHIYTRIFEHEEREHTFHGFYQQIDSFRSDFFLWITPGGIAAAKLRQSATDVAETEKALNKQLGQEDEDDDVANPEEGEG
ncbi:unnamed protein product [Parascedosporium putredinis]|uniref:Pseudouridine synthase I TruA alpha/beta domain-containing protein n=1 Tax=Parascedosporium putredinis TaxID=1442378 RepID=A0A9P1H8Q0_9PEZI|nr:unnamed protein product [Parascedosporium putredinis]CAI8001090.1 unnamed protein product [Parascedosporium putredinis]